MFKGLIGNGSHINNNREREREFSNKRQTKHKVFYFVITIKKDHNYGCYLMEVKGLLMAAPLTEGKRHTLL